MNMYGDILLVCGLCLGLNMFSQSDYKFVFDHIEFNWYNETLVDYMYIKNIKPNRTFKAFNVGFRTKHDHSGDKFKARLLYSQFLHNEYRSMPIQFDVKICEVLANNILGMKMIRTNKGNLTECPLKKNAYLIHDFNFDAATFPPYFPRGRWKMEIHILEGDAELGSVSWFGGIEEILTH